MNPEESESFWDEAQLEALLPDEHDFQEFKGSRAVIHDGKVAASFHQMLSKQLSAFANGSGGRLFIGLDDQGMVDGGVPRDLVGGGVREWLEDVIPGSVDPPLREFNVYEIAWPGPSVETRILRGHAVYVIEIAASRSAPHQAKDYRYYLRIAGKSRPMGNLHIQDVMRRTRTPVVGIARISPFGPMERVESDPRGPKANICFQVLVENRGRMLAQHLGVEVMLPRPLVSRRIRDRMLATDEVQLTQRPGDIRFFKYHPTPVFPDQELQVLKCWIGIHGSNASAVRSGEAKLSWRVYADDARAREGSVALVRYTLVREALEWLGC